MSMNTIPRALANAVGTAAYIILIVGFIFSLKQFPEPKDAFIIPVAMLLLFVCSAAITGLLVLGKPVMLYLDGKKKEAVSLLGYTLGILVLFTLAAFILLVVYL